MSNTDFLNIAFEEVERICAVIRMQVFIRLRRKGAVLGLSGGVDSSVAAALCARALGPNQVLGLLMPELDSSPESERLGRLIADWLQVPVLREDISGILDAAGCYRRRDEAIRKVVPDYQGRESGDRCKIVLPSLFEHKGFRLFSVVVRLADGRKISTRLPFGAYQAVVAATNLKQRTRKMMEYYYADHRRYAVVGTANRLEDALGFFVKNGDGAADLKPLAHLYKTQVYKLAEYLEVPEEICNRLPTTDTYSLDQSQDEFFFSLPYWQLDACLHAYEHRLDIDDFSRAVNLTPAEVERVFLDLAAKRRAAEYLHEPPLRVEI